MSERDFIIRPANVGDIDFLIEAIINADKGIGNVIPYCALFNLQESELRSILKKIFLEDVPGFEFSTETFMVAENRGFPIAAYSGWVEGAEGIFSGFLKINAFRTFLPKANIEHYRSIANILDEMTLKRDNFTLQLEATYVRENFRGKGVVSLLTEAIFRKIRKLYPMVTKAQVQLFKENRLAFERQLKLGFQVVEEKTSSNHEVLKYVQGVTRLKMEKPIN